MSTRKCEITGRSGPVETPESDALSGQRRKEWRHSESVQPISTVEVVRIIANINMLSDLWVDSPTSRNFGDVNVCELPCRSHSWLDDGVVTCAPAKRFLVGSIPTLASVVS